MILDAARLPDGTTLHAEVCIIGAGPAGITLARSLDGQSFRVILLESGGLTYDRRTQALYRGSNVGVDYEDLEHARTRAFGGSSNCWGGFCRPLDAHDFEQRDWVPNSGWPITRDDMVPYYRHAQDVLQLGPFDYEPERWEAAVGSSTTKLVPLGEGRAVNMIAQLSPPTRFGKTYQREIAHSLNVTAYLNANVTEIETPGNGATVAGVVVRTLDGTMLHVTAMMFVLATGGVETPRILLASNRYQPCGVGNEYNLVGRYFMDHPRLRSGKVIFDNEAVHSRFYDLHVTFPGGVSVGDLKLAGYFGLTPETQRAERIGNTRSYTKSDFVGDSPATMAALLTLIRAVHGRTSLLGRRKEELVNILTHLPQAAVFALGLKLKLPFLARGFSIETVVEPEPRPDSRVTLTTERDALGVPRVKVDWRVGEFERRTFQRTQEILESEFARAGVGRVVPQVPDQDASWSAALNGCWHHMGTTRMHQDARKGVVDSNCRVHGVSNLFIAGSSVFPTCGSDMPTITLVALALRLGDHIKGLFAEQRAAVLRGIPTVADVPGTGR